MSDLLNSNGTAPNNKPYYVLAGSAGCFLILLSYYLINKKSFIQNKFYIVYTLVIIGIILLTVFIIMYLSAWLLVIYPSPEDDEITKLNHNYSIMALSFLGIPILFTFFIYLQNRWFNRKKSFDEAVFYAIITTIASYTFLGLSYYLSLSIIDSYAFPLESKAISDDGVHLQSANNQNYLWAGISLTVLAFLILAVQISYLRKSATYQYISPIFITILLIFSSILFLNYTDKDDRYWTSLIPFGLALIYLIVYYGITKRPYDIYLALLAIAYISWSFFVLTLFALNASSDNLKNNYTFFLILVTFMVYSFVFISLFTLSYYNSLQLTQSKEKMFLIGASIFSSLVFAIFNSIYIDGLDIKNSSDLDDVTLSDGTKAKDFKDTGFEVLKFSLAFNYFSVFLIIASLGIITYLMYNKKNNSLFKISEFFLFKSKLKYNGYSLLLLIFSVAILNVSIFLGIYFAANNKDAFKLKYADVDDFTWSGFLPIVLVSGFVVLAFLVEFLSNLGYSDKEKSSLVLEGLRAIIVSFPLIAPIVSIISYFIRQPVFLNQVKSNDQDLLIFGDSQDKNGAPFIGNNIDRSQFSISSNFVTSGNGIFVTGGRSSLDLNITRDIIFLNNQQNYYNSKFQYTSGFDDNPEDFKAIERNGLNLFSLETNQIAYGRNNDGLNTDFAFWVAVGENVGGKNSILHNLKAGSNGLNDIPYLDSLDDWLNDDVGSFEYKGNGVASGINPTPADPRRNNIWVVVGQNKVDFSDDATIKYSESGKDWHTVAGDRFSNYGNKVAFGPSGLNISGGIKTEHTFIAVGNDSSNNNILRSVNATTWSGTSGAFFEGIGNDVVYGMSSNGTSGVWVAVGSDRNNKPVKYSIDDGMSWQDANGIFDFASEEGALTVAYDLGSRTFTVAGRKGNTNILYNSTNGKDWNAEPEYNAYDEITALNYNLVNDKNDPDFNKVYYPPSNTQNFFVEKTSSVNLKYFIIGNYITTIVLVLLFYFVIFRLNKDKYINNTGK